MLYLVIKGAYYYDRENETILIPHFTGKFVMVDCSKYVKMDSLKDSYDEDYIDQVKDNPIVFEGENYYDAEYGPISTDDWELLSDLSELDHQEDCYDFD